MKKHGGNAAAPPREPLVDLQVLRRWFDQFEGHSAESFLNILVTVGVIAFVGYQFYSLLSRINRRFEKQLENRPSKQKQETSDRACGDDSVFTDVHEQVYREKSIPYRLPYLDEEKTLKFSQLYYEEMKMRRSVRAFSSRSVPMKVIENLIKTAGTAPSVGNIQPWKFCVVMNDSLKLMIREILEADERDNYVARKKGAAWVVDVSQLQDTWRRPYITDAPTLFVVCHEVFTEVNEQPERLYNYNQLGTAIAVGVLLAAIQNVGLSTVVTSPLNVGPDISRLLRRPQNENVGADAMTHRVLLLLPLGYAAEDAVVPDLKRKPVENITKLYL